jgi:hypothetical protein
LKGSTSTRLDVGEHYSAYRTSEAQSEERGADFEEDTAEGIAMRLAADDILAHDFETVVKGG